MSVETVNRIKAFRATFAEVGKVVCRTGAKCQNVDFAFEIFNIRLVVKRRSERRFHSCGVATRKNADKVEIFVVVRDFFTGSAEVAVTDYCEINHISTSKNNVRTNVGNGSGDLDFLSFSAKCQPHNRQNGGSTHSAPTIMRKFYIMTGQNASKHGCKQKKSRAHSV